MMSEIIRDLTDDERAIVIAAFKIHKDDASKTIDECMEQAENLQVNERELFLRLVRRLAPTEQAGLWSELKAKGWI